MTPFMLAVQDARNGRAVPEPATELSPRHLSGEGELHALLLSLIRPGT
jgi:hypothetical protein